MDGRFGAGTQRAVISFQKDNGLEADGLAGTKTLELLYKKADGTSSSSGSSSGSGTSSGLTRTLRRGYTGDDVITVQQRLKELGYYTGSIDGVYGSGSIAAATAFQKNNGLKVDGLTRPEHLCGAVFQLGRGSWFFRLQLFRLQQFFRRVCQAEVRRQGHGGQKAAAGPEGPGL